MIVQGQKEQKQVVIRHETKIYIKACYLPWILIVNSTNKERKCNDRFIKKANILEINKWGVLIRSGGLERNQT